MYSVYVLTVPDGKAYVGATSTSVEERWNNGNGYRSNKGLWDAILHYGWAQVTKSVVATGLSEDEASELEKHYIKLLGSTDPDRGFNKELGGIKSQKIISEESREKMRQASLGEKNHNYGTHFSETHRQRISASNTGKKRSEKTCVRIGESKKKTVLQYTAGGEFIATFRCARDAASQTGAQPGHISKVCKGQRHTAGGYVWKFAQQQ